MKLGEKFFCRKKGLHVGMKVEKHGNKVEIKTQKDSGEEGQEEYLTSVLLTCMHTIKCVEQL